MDVLIDKGLEAIVAIVAAVIVPFVVRVLQKLAQRFNLQISAEQQARIEYWVRLAIARAEEYAAEQIRKSNRVVTGREKLEHAIAFVLDKVPGITPQEAQELVYALLPAVGAGAAAALGQVTAAATNEAR